MTVKVVSNTAVKQPEVREQIINMTGHSSDEEFIASLPSNTDTAFEETKPKRKYTRRNLTGTGTTDKQVETDPIALRFNQRANSLGGAALIKTGFKKAGFPLDNDEEAEVSDFFHVLSKKANMDITGSWFLMGLYCTFMLIRFFLVRSEMMQKFSDLLNGNQKGKADGKNKRQEREET